MRHVLAALVALVTALGVAAPVSRAQAAGVTATIDISAQQITVDVGGVTQYIWPVSTGRKGYGTPTGAWRPTRMYRTYYSRKYDNSPMPHSIFFRGGYAIHGTNYIKNLGRPASHGCIRLHPTNAATLYSLVKEHGRGATRIRIVR